MGNFDFSEKKILITGASSGIGRATAIQLDAYGADLILVGRNEERLNETKSLLKGSGHQTAICDVSDFDGVQKMIKEAVKSDGRKLDGFVHSAGQAVNCPVLAATEHALENMLRVNFYSYVSAVKAFSSRRLSNDGSSFVAVSSRAALIPDKSQGFYATSKAAVNTYTVVAAKEMSVRGIRFNTVCPEVVDTPMGHGLKENLSDEQLRAVYPLGMLEASDVADTISFLLSDLSKKITGQSIWLSAGNVGTPIEGYFL